MLVTTSTLILVFVAYSTGAEETQNVKAKAVLYLNKENESIGTIDFEEFIVGAVIITGRITGLTPGKHAFHIHETNDFSNGCKSTGGHYNPFNKDHGAPDDEQRHVGDLGNILAEQNGVANVTIVDIIVQLSGTYSIVNRSIVVHTGEDDLGNGGHKDSKTTGNAGERFACGAIKLITE